MTESSADGRNRLCIYSGGFLTEGRLKRILGLSGWDVAVGLPGENDWVGIWGRTPRAWRGEAIAGWTDAPVLTVEDAFLRSIHPGRVRGEAPLGLCLDKTGVHFDGATASDLEKICATHPLDDTALLNRARAVIDSLKHWHLGKYAAFDPDIEPPDPGYVLVVDQTAGDAALGDAGRAAFKEMLAFALAEHPGAQVLIKTHPETDAGKRAGHFSDEDENERVRLYSATVSPWVLFEGAVAVYAHSSTLGFEAILAGHKPRIFGQPFYAGWGLTQDENAPPRRNRNLTRAQLVAAALILYPVWYDPVKDQLCEIEDVIYTLAASARAWREDRFGYAIKDVKPWKRPHLKRAFGREKPVRFGSAKGTEKPVVWGMRDAKDGTLRMEDGFLRSRGLGAALTPPLSLVLDSPSLYFDPTKAGRLDELLAKTTHLPAGEIQRAERLLSEISRLKLTKYNLTGDLPEIPKGKRTLLVPGQVEDDASITFGADTVRTNLALLQAVRAENPDAFLLWKPHPDVEAGLRKGHVTPDAVQELADATLSQVNAHAALSAVDEVWTITSTIGFEALLRGISVTCFGMPFYAGRGLTQDRATRPDHRTDVTLTGMVHACLISYPRYFDPRTGAPISPEAAVWLLANGVEMPPVNKALAWLRRFLP